MFCTIIEKGLAEYERTTGSLVTTSRNPCFFLNEHFPDAMELPIGTLEAENHCTSDFDDFGVTFTSMGLIWH